MGLPDILNVHEITVQMMYIVCLVGFSPGVLEFWLTINQTATDAVLSPSDAMLARY